MWTIDFVKIESRTSDWYPNMLQIPYQENSETKLLNLKRIRDVEDFRTHMIFYEPDQEEVNKAFMSVFPMFQENNILEKDEKSCEDGPRNLNKKIKEEKSLFKVFYPDLYLFTKATEDLLKDYLKGVDFSIKTRSEERLPNYLQKHYIRVNIKRTFMNRYLLIALNKLLKEAGFIIFFERFPQSFANNVTKDKCRIIMNMRLKEIFRARELYEDIDNKKFEHNLVVVDAIEKEGTPKLNMILNRKLRCLFEEYVDSEEFGIVELNRLKKSKIEKDEYYLKKYVFLAKHLIEFCMGDDE